MAFYDYNNGDIDDCQWISYSDDITYDHDLFPPQSPSRSSFYEFDVPKSIQNCYDYNQSAEHYYSVYGYNEPILIQYEQSPSYVYGYNEPILIQYEQSPSYVNESLYHNTTTYRTSYSTLEFNEPEFDEYDTTPYGGGYDIVTTYGKPLPPSDDICYPRSNPKQRRVTFAIPESVDVENVGMKPQIANGIVKENKPNADTKPQIANGIGIVKENKPNADTKPQIANGIGIGIVKENKPNAEIDNVEKPIEVDPNRVDEDLDYDYGKGFEGNDEVTKYPYGSGLEAMDICDSIFGYWPCLEKIKKQNLGNGKVVDDHDHDHEGDPWTSAADYLFGSGFMYEEESRGNSTQGHGYYLDGHHFDYSYK